MVQSRGLGTTARSARRRRGAIEPIARFDDRPSPPTRGWRERGQDSQALGRSRGGFSTKIHVAVSGEGQPVKLHLTEGQRHDVTCAEILMEGLEPEFVIGDKGYDSDPLRDGIRSIGAKPVIPSRRTHRIRRHDRQRYKLRNVVERFINKIKNCRRVATRYDKLAVTFLGFVQFASILTLPLNVRTK
jgi:transposase